MSLHEIMKKQAEFDEAHAGRAEWTQPISSENLQPLEHGIVCLVGEIGEFANVVKKVVRGDVKYEEVKGELREEITDAFIYLIKLCNALDIDLESAFHERLDYNWRRFKTYEK